MTTTSYSTAAARAPNSPPERWIPSVDAQLTAYTTEPGVQLYTSNFLQGELVGTTGKTYRQSAGFTLETQHFPDSPNQPSFPSTTLNPGTPFDSTTVFDFGVARRR